MAEYMIVENNIITGIFCGEVEKGENIVILPPNHQVRCGETFEYYNKDWTRKSRAELIKLGLEECPQGYILDGDDIRLMDFEERVVAGIEPLTADQKIVDGKLVNKTEEELWEEKTPEEKAKYHRQKRDHLINSEIWKIQRHEQEKFLGVETTLTEDEYQDLLKYIQALRDLTKQKGFPDDVKYPVL